MMSGKKCVHPPRQTPSNVDAKSLLYLKDADAGEHAGNEDRAPRTGAFHRRREQRAAGDVAHRAEREHEQQIDRDRRGVEDDAGDHQEIRPEARGDGEPVEQVRRHEEQRKFPGVEDHWWIAASS
jgi:hypothetical protein